MKPSKYQTAVYKAYNETNQNIFVEACPGSGKSTTILQLLKQTPFHKKAILLAFNKSIADELRQKVSKTVEVSTIHSFSFKLLRQNFSVPVNLNEIKTYILAKNFFKSRKKHFKNEKDQNVFLFTVAKIYDLMRMNISKNNQESIEKIAQLYGVDLLDSDYSDVVVFIEHINGYNENPSDNFMIDYTDMLWLTYKHVKKNKYPKYSVVFCDEVQDLNPLQKVLIDNLVSMSGRFVVVGDEKQSIYGFMGANLKSLHKFKNAPDTTCLPLSISYRCHKQIVDHANKIFPGMEHFESNTNGEVREGFLSDIREGDFVICRNNLPLIDAFIYLLAKGKKARILGRDLETQLTKLINSVDVISELFEVLEHKKTELSKKGIKKPEKNPSYLNLEEKIKILLVINQYTDADINKTRSLLQQMFSDNYTERDIVLMTGHKSKGLENERVVYLYPELIPSEYATSEYERYQEKCLDYVITTRAKKELIIVNDIHQKYTKKNGR